MPSTRRLAALAVVVLPLAGCADLAEPEDLTIDSDTREAPATTEAPTTTTTTEPPPVLEPLQQWVLANPGVPDALNGTVAVMQAVADAADTYDIVELDAACERLGDEALKLRGFSGPGQPARWDSFLDNLWLSAEACDRGDYTLAAVNIRMVSSDLDAMTTEMSAANARATAGG